MSGVSRADEVLGGSVGFGGVGGVQWGVGTKTGIALISLEPPLPLPFIVPAE